MGSTFSRESVWGTTAAPTSDPMNLPHVPGTRACMVRCHSYRSPIQVRSDFRSMRASSLVSCAALARNVQTVRAAPAHARQYRPSAPGMAESPPRRARTLTTRSPTHNEILQRTSTAQPRRDQRNTDSQTPGRRLMPSKGAQVAQA
jgi:hypothetical protein